MKKMRSWVITITAVFICVTATWLLRGLYDKHFMFEGYFHIVSSAKQDHKMSLVFPSGKKIAFDLAKGGNFDFKLHETGEGDIAIIIDGKERERVGYVTSQNNIVVLVIDDEHSSFSQIFYNYSPNKRVYLDARKPAARQ